MTPFQARGYNKNTRFKEKTPEYFPEGTILKIHNDDGSVMPSFIAADGSGNFRWMYLNSIERTEHTPFTSMGYTKDTVFRVIAAGGFTVGTLVKLSLDDGSHNPRFCAINDESHRHYVTFATRLEVVEPAATPATPKREGEKYNRVIKDSVGEGKTLTVDVYSVLAAFEVNNSAIAHAVKKLLAPGKRGVKSEEQDIREAIGSLERALKM